jgi:hypothetical protein
MYLQRTLPPVRIKQHQVYRECVLTVRSCLFDVVAQQHITIAYILYILSMYMVLKLI